MANYKLPLSFDEYGTNELRAISKQFKSKKYTMGESVKKFEQPEKHKGNTSNNSNKRNRSEKDFHDFC